MQRNRDFLTIIAAQGRGKTTKLMELINSRLKQNERFIVIVPDTSEPTWFPYEIIFADELEQNFDVNFTGVICLEFEFKKTIPFLADLMKNNKLKSFSLVMDDPSFVEDYQDKELKYIMSRRRQFDFDMFTTGHTYDSLPPLFYRYLSLFCISHIDSPISLRTKHLGENYHFHKNKIIEVNRLTGNDKEKKCYHNFYVFRKNGKNLNDLS